MYNKLHICSAKHIVVRGGAVRQISSPVPCNKQDRADEDLHFDSENYFQGNFLQFYRGVHDCP